MLIAGALFSGAAGHEFVWDDFAMLRDAPEIRNPLDIKAFFTTTQCDLYRPFGVFTNSLIYAARGLDARTYHIFNIILYCICAGLLYFVALEVFGRERWKALAAAALFAVHPMHVEPVAWISGMEDLLCGALLLSALLCFMNDRGGERLGLYAAGCALFILGLLSKELAVVFPALVVAADLFLKRIRLSWKLVLMRLPLFILALAFLGVRFYAIGVVEQAKVIYGWQMSTVIPSVLKLFPHYLGQFANPANLCPDFGAFTLAHSIFEPIVLATIAGLLAATVVFFIALKRSRVLAFIIAWFAITIFPFLHLVPIGTFCADRFMFLPSAGACLFVALAFSAVSGAAKKNPAAKFVIFAVLVSATALFWAAHIPKQIAIWKDEVTLYTAMTQCAPRSYYSYNKLGYALADKKLLDESEAAFQKAAEINPSNIVIWTNLGELYGRQGRFREAEAALVNAHNLDPANTTIMLRLAIAVQNQGRYAEAADIYSQILQRSPDNAEVRERLRQVILLINQPTKK